MPRTPGGTNLNLVVYELSDQGPCNGRGDRDESSIEIGLVLAHDSICDLEIVVDIEETNGGPEHHSITGETRWIDYFCSGKTVLEIGDSGLDEALLLLGGMILGILAQVPMLSCDAYLLRDLWSLDGL